MAGKTYVYRHIIVGVSYLIGIGTVLNIIPPISQLGTNQPYIVAAILAAGAFVWWKEYHERAQRMNVNLRMGFNKTPDYDIRQQQPARGREMTPGDAAAQSIGMPPPMTPRRPQSNMPPVKQPVVNDAGLFDAFEKN